MITGAQRKLLFIAGYFPPVQYSSGSVRAWNIAKHLTRLGWQVTVVTPHPSLWRQYYVESSEGVASELRREGINCIYTDYYWRCLAPDRVNCWNEGVGWFLGGVCRRISRWSKIDNWIGWLAAIEKACAHLAHTDVDVILVTGDPHISFQAARRLSIRLRCPFVLDYRDLWTNDPHKRPEGWAAIRRERRLLNESAAVMAISPSIGAVLDNKYGVGRKLHIVTNGYDSEEMMIAERKRYDQFAVVYAGGIHPPLRVITPVLSALQLLKKCAPHLGWKFHYYGADGKYVLKDAERLELMDRVVIHGKVSRAEALAALKGSDMAVVVTSVSERPSLEERGIVTGKIFEAIGMGVPMLVVAPTGSDVEAIVGTAGLGNCFEAIKVEEMAAYIKDVMRGDVPARGQPEDFSWMSIARQIEEVCLNAVAV